MSRYSGDPEFEHGSPARTGVLLANLGTPDSPAARDVRKFLAEFLWDPRVVEAPRWLWWLALHGVILRIRPSRSAHAYRQIWTDAGSPLLLHSRALARKVADTVGSQGIQSALGMTYGSPSIASALEELRAAKVRRLLVLPLYPQYSATTTASVFDRVTGALQRWRWLPELRFVTNYHDEPLYIDAITASISDYWARRERTHLLFSFHGIPRRYLLAGDPYHCQCHKTARLVAAQLGLRDNEWSLSFQSQVGREEWLRPYTDETLLEYARQGRRKVTVVSPGFAADCLETLEEIELRNRAAFMARGGEDYGYVPALNEGEPHVALISRLIERHTAGWTADAADKPADARTAVERALRLGAAR
jgi:protoporphyrin/coproporphyrin ferrochelatase